YHRAPTGLDGSVLDFLPRGKGSLCRVEIVQSHSNLMEIVLTRRATSRFSGRLNCWEQERYQDADDGNHYQQFHERERPSIPKVSSPKRKVNAIHSNSSVSRDEKTPYCVSFCSSAFCARHKTQWPPRVQGLMPTAREPLAPLR